MASHPDLAAEQAYIDNAYSSLERSREEATRLRSMVEVGKGGTEQARWEREMIEGNIAQRLASLQLGDASLVFGRIDRTSREGGDSYYIGRLAVSDEHREPLVVDWRAPVAEPFYRATGREPMGLVRRRHFATRGRQLLAIEDELFGESAGLLGGELSVVDDGREIRGRSTLITALEEARTGRLSDIVATIQGEQDEIIRAELPGVLVVQGGPGTGKTVVALHRAAYLLYTHRFPLEGQGVLVVGPNRLFLGYIEQVLPSLGEAGVELAVLADLLDGTIGVAIEGRDRPLTARVKGDLRMAKVLAKAVHDRQRPLRRTMRVGYGLQTLSLTPGQSQAIVADAKRRFRLHNAGRRHVEASVFATLADSARVPVEAHEVRERLRHAPEVREALERMWPVLTPADLLHDLFGSAALIVAGGRSRAERRRSRRRSCARGPSTSEDAVWTVDDVPLLDEARALLGPKPKVKRPGPARRRRGAHLRPHRRRRGAGPLADAAADAHPPLAQRLDDRRGRHRPVHRRVGPRRLGRGARAAARPPAGPPHRAHHRLPPARPEHGAGHEGAGAGRARPHARRRRCARRATSPASSRRPPAGSRPRSSSRRCVERDAVDPGSVAVIVPDSLLAAGRRRLRGAGHRVRPSRPQRPQQPDHRRAGEPREGPRARRLGGGRARGHPRGGGAGRAVALRARCTRATKRLVRLVHERPAARRCLR